jgi:hypothetical protein
MIGTKARLTGLLATGFAALCAATLPSPGQATSSSQPLFSGEATVVRAQVLDLPPIVLAGTGFVEGPEFAEEATLVEAEVTPGQTAGLVGLSAEVLHAATVAGGEAARSEASVASLDVTVAGNTIGADFLMARASASCGPNGPSLAGSAEIANLVVNGQAITVGAPNQRVELPNGFVIVDEETTQVSGNKGEITVNALHVVVNDPLTGARIADVVIASAHADVLCAGPPLCPNPNDFVTGGGFISGKRHFAVAGGIKRGLFWGHLTYADRGAALKVKGSSVTRYESIDPTTRRIEGTAEINGAPGTYEAIVSDNGEPGRNDRFSIRLSTGYFAAGMLEGGNIQLHKPCR